MQGGYYVRFRVGHSWLTHAFLTQGRTHPLSALDVSAHRHCDILLECVDFMALRQHCFNVNGMQYLFTNMVHKQVFRILKNNLTIS